MRTLLFLLSIALFDSNPVAAETINLTPVKDNTLFEHDTGGLSNGAGSYLFAGTTRNGAKRRAVLAFDLSTIPTDATIHSASLSMAMTRTVSDSHTVSLHRLLTPWGEGLSDATGEEGTGAPTESGDATWVHTISDSVLWTTPGGDFAAAASNTLNIIGIGGYTWPSTQELIADVQAWVQTPADNFGWIIIGDESANSSAKRFNSSEHGESPPILSIDYTPATGSIPDRSATISLAPSKDNSLFEDDNGTLSNGSGQFLFVGRTGQPKNRRALLAFEFSSVPSNAAITSAALTMNLSRTSPGGTQTIALHKVLSDWGEGASNAGSPGGSGGAATTGDATWLHAFSDATLWTNPGGDFSDTTSASLDIANNGSYTWASTEQLISDVQGWIQTPTSNFGWILLGNESDSRTAKRFDSRENATGGNRPKLELAYSFSNSAPTVVNPVGDQQYIAGQDFVTIDLSGVFSDGDGDELSYSALTADPSIASVLAVDGGLSIMPLSQGTTTLTTIVNDGFGGMAASPFGIAIIAAPSQLVGDFNDSDTVDFDDFFIFADNFGQSVFNQDTDLDADSDVDFDDFFIFADHFGETASQ